MPFPRSFRLRVAGALLVSAIGVLASAVSCFAYALEGESWPSGQIRMQLQITPATNPPSDGKASLNDSALDALSLWNPNLQRAQFVGSIAPAGFTPRNGDGINSVFSSGDVYGQTFGDSTLAVTLLGYEGTTLTETDVLINNGFQFDSYTGPLRPEDSSGRRVEDLHRILLHEFGHVLGLAHPDQAGQNVSAIMNAAISDLDHLTDDDIAGAHYLYDTNASGTGTGSNGPGSFAKIKGDKTQISKMAYSPATGNIYAIGKRKGLGNNILTIYNPYTFELPDVPPFVEPPETLAISPDGRYLYVAFVVSNTQQRIRRLDLFTDQVDEDFPVVAPGSPNADPMVVDLQAAPDAPDVLAVSETYIDPSSTLIGITAAVVIYNQGQPLANPATYLRPSGFQLQFAGNAAQLLATPTGYDDQIHRLAVSAAGVSDQGGFRTAISTAGSTFLFNGGYLFNSEGQELDPATGAVVRQIIPTSVSIYDYAIDPNASRIFYRTNSSASLLAYSLPDGESLGSVPLPASTEGHFFDFTLLAWGQNGLAFGSSGLRGLYVARSVAFGDDPTASGNPDTLTLDAPATGSISQNSGQALKFKILRTSGSLGDSSVDLTAHYAVSGTGINGVNFRALTGSVVIPAGKAFAKVKIVPQADSLTNGPAVVTISLVADPGYVIAAPATATVTITQE